MSNKTIAKFFTFVISLASVCSYFSGCSDVSSNTSRIASESRYDPPKVIGTIKTSDITESSGIAASKCQNNVLWTHNDSGDDAYLFAINAAGDSLGTWKLTGAQNIDWEDIATYKDKNGGCFVYVGDVGDNKRKRKEHAVYRVKEPAIGPLNIGSSRKNPITTELAEMIRFSYPDYDQDAETLMVHPKTGDIYVVTKRISGPAGVYRLRAANTHEETVKIEKIAEISVPAIPNGYLTGGDISPDGSRVIVCDYSQAYEFTLPNNTADFEEIWKQEPVTVSLGGRKQGEGVCYSADGSSIFATTEGKNSPLIEAKRDS